MVTKDSKYNTRITWAMGTLLILLWVALTFQGFVSAIKIWYISEIFNHCFIVLPISFYLIWEKRKKINWRERKVSLLSLPFIIMQVLLYVVGIAGDIQLFQHAAMFSLLPLLIWFYFGNRIAKHIIFPLFFMLFAIPFGEELIPFLQELTADISVQMLSWVGVPLYRSGLFIEIPQGRFLVAEACSGVSFLIASVVLGNLYAYTNLKRIKTRIFFVLLSIVFPILANAVRVFGIIMVGYASDMKHAVGADHLIYGWFFFATVIICLLSVGEVVRRIESHLLSNKQSDVDGTSLAIDTNIELKISKEASSTKVESLKIATVKSLLVAVVLSLGVLKSTSIQSALSVSPMKPDFTLPFDVVQKGNVLSTWQPAFQHATSAELLTLEHKASSFAYFLAYYDGTSGELISSVNNVFAEKRWSLAGLQKEAISKQVAINNMSLKSAAGQQINVYHLYIIRGVTFTDSKYAKLYQVWLKLQGKPFDGVFLAISTSQDDERFDMSNDVLETVVKSIVEAFEERDMLTL